MNFLLEKRHAVGVGSNRRSVPIRQLVGDIVDGRIHRLRKIRSGQTPPDLGAPTTSIVLVGQTAHRSRSQLIVHAVDARVIIVTVGQHDSVRQSQRIAPVRVVVAHERVRAALADFIEAVRIIVVVVHGRLAGDSRSLP